MSAKDDREKSELDFIHQGHIYHAEVGKKLVMDGNEIEELVTDILDLGSMYRIKSTDRIGDLMAIRHDEVLESWRNTYRVTC